MADINVAWVVTAIKTANYTPADWGECVRCDPSGGGFSITFPPAAGAAGRQIQVKNTTSSTNTLTYDGNSSETVDGSATQTSATALSCITFESDGTNVMRVAAYP